MNLVKVQLSDNLIFMRKTLTATEVARNFSEVLSLVEGGDEIEITRGKKVVAYLKPQQQSSNAANVISEIHLWKKQFKKIDEETASDYLAILARRDAPENKARGISN